MEKGLCWNTTPVEAGASDLILFNDGDPGPQLAGPDCSPRSRPVPRRSPQSLWVPYALNTPEKRIGPEQILNNFR